jgi:hypothetical protein
MMPYDGHDDSRGRQFFTGQVGLYCAASDVPHDDVVGGCSLSWRSSPALGSRSPKTTKWEQWREGPTSLGAGTP